MTPSADEHSLHHRIREYFRQRSERAEHDPNPLFGGRDRIVDAVLRDVERLRHSPGPLKNLSTVLYGAPGAGKSETLLHLRKRMASMSTDKHPVWAVDGTGDMLRNARAFEIRLRRELPALWRDRIWRRAQVSGGFNAGVAQLAISQKDDPDLPELARLTTLTDAINDRGKRPTIVLLIDEAQAKLSEAVEIGPTFARPLHDGEIDLKVLPVYAGLGNTLDELWKCGVSRLEPRRDHLMEPLSRDAVLDMVRLALRSMTDRSADTIDDWADAIGKDSDGWPKHLSNTLGCVADIAEPRDWTLDRDGFAATMESAGRARAKYYNDRLNRVGTALQPEQFSAWADMFDGLEFVTEGTISESLRIDAPEAEALARKAVHAGLLEKRDPGCYIAPIPSLVAHIAELGRGYDSRAKPRGQVR